MIHDVIERVNKEELVLIQEIEWRKNESLHQLENRFHAQEQELSVNATTKVVRMLLAKKGKGSDNNDWWFFNVQSTPRNDLNRTGFYPLGTKPKPVPFSLGSIESQYLLCNSGLSGVDNKAVNWCCRILRKCSIIYFLSWQKWSWNCRRWNLML
jgi:hypothetical protein